MSQADETIGKYQILSEAGRGGMGVVYKAFDPHLHRHVAIKVLAESLAADPETRARFLTEARAAASLQHPNIVGVFEAGDFGESSYFVMELIEGEDLAGLISRRGGVPFDEALPILEKIASALDYAHSKGIVHRDIKPANVLLGSGEPKVADFGIARVAGTDRQTQTGMLIGTPHYMAPELWDGKQASSLSDQYALGVLAFELLCGSPPYDGESFMSIGWKHVNGPIPRPTAPGLGAVHEPRVAKALERALAKNPANRFANCADFIGACKPALANTPVRGKSGVTMFGLLGAIVLLAGGFALSRGGAKSEPTKGALAAVDSKIAAARDQVREAKKNLEGDTIGLKNGTDKPNFLQEHRYALDDFDKNTGILADSSEPLFRDRAYYYRGVKDALIAFNYGFNPSNGSFHDEIEKGEANLEKFADVDSADMDYVGYIDSAAGLIAQIEKAWTEQGWEVNDWGEKKRLGDLEKKLRGLESVPPRGPLGGER